MSLTKSYNYHITHFMKSAATIQDLSVDNGIEIAFVGRSNSGKSSAINILTNQKNLARTSKIPGRTQLINLFEVEQGIRLVDLPGYGYAAVPENVKRNWQQAISEYLQKRDSLKGLVIFMDIRHPMKELDRKIVAWAANVNIPILVLLTKADKLSPEKCKAQLKLVRKVVLEFIGDVQIATFSAVKKQGVDTLWQKLDVWFGNNPY
ncbi:ribosome biogenesis GTP-binding protein YihA/YsxC [Candidatus Steffania adelgidicola]|uniref:ribosome biogenesis GTP-binding protein YihA/YsxC n=1 Tax=Candidatus Steffania adelgidicola TaxID=1076626 RepID=UPI001D0046C0|nr:ribosome biogenesis GTP-binding protein YihA/YsxC [Candidatus Steffania adelgidicola]UDG80046.1 putative GTP-binding protein EngB [Candidatus Steffania adelgidicola]